MHSPPPQGKTSFQRFSFLLANSSQSLRSFRATTNKKLKETVALELSFVNSNLQLLKEQLAELNSSVELYQNETRCVFLLSIIRNLMLANADLTGVAEFRAITI
jgi:hypothetical protein